MRRILSKLGAVLAGVSLMLPSTANADVTLKLEPGVVVPMTAPQTDRFNPGASLTVKPLVGLGSYLDVGPSVSFLQLQSRIPGIDNGTVWALGGTVRLKRPRDEKNEGTGFSAASPWIDADLQYVRTGPLDRAGVAVGVGVQVPTSDARTLWVGPFARYQDVVQGVRAGFDNTDAHLMIFGLSAEFGPAAKPKVCDRYCSDRDGDGVVDAYDRCPDVPGPVSNEGCPEGPKAPPPPPCPETPPPAAPPPARVQITQVIPFKADSAVLDTMASVQLGDVVRLLADQGDWRLEVQGHASSEGPPEPYNTKLSQKRAQAVVDFLAARGLPADRMTAKGFGATVPAASNDSLEGRSQNRRVEFKVDFVIVRTGATK